MTDTARTDLPQPTTPNHDTGYGGELEAIQAIYNAYMALNAADGPMAWEDGPGSPMKLMARGAVNALSRLPGVNRRQAHIIWDAMCDGASGAHYAYDLWRRGDI